MPSGFAGFGRPSRMLMRRRRKIESLRLPHLVKLKLACRGGSQQFKICNKTLHLELVASLFQKVDVNVDAPNLISFGYDKCLISIGSFKGSKVTGKKEDRPPYIHPVTGFGYPEVIRSIKLR
ncbi:hypothetical protein L484_001987 [Morus notabilis]|uniref:Uncharacterized protein n=1 Tax=Morus notabilis TaxID=981085 RepID=W9S282_9ROSA|nr:hypothetical protein L484_001987 [Morus notabilis]